MSSGNVHAVDSNPYVSLVPWHGDQSSENYPSAETIPASFQNFQQTVYPYSVPYSQSYSGNAGYNSVYQQFAGLNAAYTQYFPSDAFYSQ